MKKIEYQSKQVRIFLALLTLLLVLLTLKWTRGSETAGRYIWMTVEIAGIGLFMVLPKLFFPVYRLILIGSGYIGNFIFGAISTLVFFLLLTPIAGIMRLLGKRFMSVRPDPSALSYYEEGEDPGNVDKQF
jgi:hypothetical protein